MKLHILPVTAAILFLASCTIHQPSPAMTEKSNASQDGSTITVIGTAENSKMSACVITDNGVYFVIDMASWSDEYHKKKVKVTGILETRSTSAEDLKDENGNYSQGAVGETKMLKKAKVELVK